VTTRIIGGSAGGRRLRTLRGDLTRPTTDRVREALFSSLDSALGSLEGLRVLDLYAGSGAVGLEARSRGAAAVLLVERDKRAAGLIADNARDLDLDVDVVQAPVSRHLASAAASAYDVVFADPPYDMAGDEVHETLAALARNAWLARGALVVVERSRRSDALRWPDGYEPLRSRTYGETALAFGRWTGDAASLWYGRDQPSAEES
jgi:16S rRNA (guanine966-N2)-methyltransferase